MLEKGAEAVSTNVGHRPLNVAEKEALPTEITEVGLDYHTLGEARKARERRERGTEGACGGRVEGGRRAGGGRARVGVQEKVGREVREVREGRVGREHSEKRMRRCDEILAKDSK